MSHRLGDCPICKKPFQNGDDIVICPYCGAPYHRACYTQQGHCSFEDKHKQGFEYRAVPKKAPGAAAEAGEPAGQGAQEAPPPKGKVLSEAEGGPKRSGGILCERCGTVNDARNIFCEKCGAPLHGAAPAGTGNGAQGPYGGAQPGGGLFGGMGGFGGAGTGAGGPEVDMSGEIDGIPKEDWAEFIGKSAPVYLARLDQMQQRGRKVSFMVSAFIVPHLYFAYRKLWGWMVLAILNNLLSLGVNVLMVAIESGLLNWPGATADTLWMISVLGSYLFLAVQVVFGLFALQLYRRNAVKKMKAAKAAAQAGEAADGDDAYRAALAKKGGVCIPAVVAVGVALVLLSMALSYYIGDDLINYLAAMI